MARKTASGTFIISAGEVGEYTVCPESWRLRAQAESKSMKVVSEDVQRGDALHRAWAADYSEAVVLARTLRLVLALFALALLTTVLVRIG